MYEYESDASDSSESSEDVFDEISLNSDSSDEPVDDASSDDGDDVIIEFDDFSDDEEDEIAIERIYNEDCYHLDSEKTHGKYYIGLCKYIARPKLFLMLNSVSPRTYFRYQYFHVLKYLYYYSSVRFQCPKIEIMKLEVLDDGTYSTILKTFWIRIIQRHWRNVFKKRQEIFKGRTNLNSILIREVTGRYPYGLNVLPSFIGMLRHYAK